MDSPPVGILAGHTENAERRDFFMKWYKGLIAAAVLTFFAVGCGGEQQAQEPGGSNNSSTILQAQLPAENEDIAVITTSLGDITLRFYPEEAPKAVENFKTLAKDGYYDGVIFHRVIEDFMIQTGDPTGTGSGGESCWGEDFEDEVSEKLHFYRGALAMANHGQNTNGSQFFIVQQKDVTEEALSALQEARDTNGGELEMKLHGEYFTFNDLFPDEVLDYYREQGGAAHLEYAFGSPYTIFGQVIDGMDVVDAIAAADTDSAAKPLEEITIEKIVFENYTAE